MRVVVARGLVKGREGGRGSGWPWEKKEEGRDVREEEEVSACALGARVAVTMHDGGGKWLCAVFCFYVERVRGERMAEMLMCVYMCGRNLGCVCVCGCGCRCRWGSGALLGKLEVGEGGRGRLRGCGRVALSAV